MFEKGMWSPQKASKEKSDDDNDDDGYGNVTMNMQYGKTNLFASLRDRSWRFGVLLSIGMLLISSYYSYLTSLYLVDEVYDGDGPRELDIAEKYTVRVVGGSDSEALGKFVSKYSLCQQVDELQILWNSAEPHPSLNSFVFAHTHSKVSFIRLGPVVESYAAAVSPSGVDLVLTEAVMLLDQFIEIDCQDLAFAHSIWRSGPSALVGFFPYLHRRDPVSARFSVYSWMHVWWNGAYSLLHPTGLVLHKNLLRRLRDNESLQKVLQLQPKCHQWVLSVLSGHEHPLSSPIWVDVPARLRVPLSNSNLSGPELQSGGTCIDALTDALSHKRLPYSLHKSSRANSFLFWTI